MSNTAAVQTAPMFLVYADANGDHHYQPWGDVVDSGTLIDPETGEDMKVVGWSTESKTPALDADELAVIERLRSENPGPNNLDIGIPFDIYALFLEVTGRDYDGSPADELHILDVAAAFER